MLSFLLTAFFWCAIWYRIWRSSSGRLWMTVGCGLGVWVCLYGWPLLPLFGVDVIGLWFWRGLWGDLSVATLSLLTLQCCANRVAQSDCLWWLIAALGVVFYPMTLGWGMLDPYQWGYENAWFLGVVILVGLVALWQNIYWVAAWLVLAVLCWEYRVFESNNLWDYLLDPIAWLMSLVHCVFRIVRN